MNRYAVDSSILNLYVPLYILLTICFCIFLISLHLTEQSNAVDEAPGLTGNNLNLYADLKQFQKSFMHEEFEKKLNDPENKVNNPGLNGANDIAYIMVSDNVEKNGHSIPLQVAVNRNEIQEFQKRIKICNIQQLTKELTLSIIR
jgi:hypothetical protein